MRRSMNDKDFSLMIKPIFKKSSWMNIKTLTVEVLKFIALTIMNLENLFLRLLGQRETI